LTAAVSSSVVPPAVSGMPSHARIAIFAATVWEVSAVRAALPGAEARRVDGRRIFAASVGGREYWLTRTGVGHEKAARTASWMLSQAPFDLAISTGFACALVPADIGGLLVGQDATAVQPGSADQSGPHQTPGAEREAFLAFVAEHAPDARLGKFLSVDRIVGRASDKMEYARVTGAIGLDMESAALALESQRAGVPFVIVRTVSDLVDEDLPLDFNRFFKATGWVVGIGTVLAAPWRLRGLGRLRRQSRLAAARLTELFRAYVAMAVDPPYHKATREPA
jgi:adenosylhomocysteine nucleosidase